MQSFLLQVIGCVPFLDIMLSARHISCTLVLVFIATGCTKKNVDLCTRITAARTSQYCHSDACFSPHILVIEKGYFVTVFTGDRPQGTAVSTSGLGEYLTALPTSAWPSGPIVGMTPSYDVIDSRAIHKNLDQAQRTCQSLGLDVQFRPGG